MTGRHPIIASSWDAHAAAPAPDLEGRVWRAVGDPLVAATGSGPLQGMSVAVKDLFAVEGFAIGAGSEEWLAEARPETMTAASPAALLASGAVVAGIARTDEFAYSLAGTNTHYGTPPNPKAPDRISGGSSSGPASAVSLGQADIGLGTDTGGSIRVPAAYQGLYGIRTTHGAVSVRGLLPLAPSFDTVGWMTRDAATLAAVGSVLLPSRPRPGPRGDLPPTCLPRTKPPISGALVASELLELVEPEVGVAVKEYLAAWAVTVGLPDLRTAGLRTEELPAWLTAFQTVQGYEAWQHHGPWISRHWGSLGADVAGRFDAASRIDRGQADDARDVLRTARQHIRSVTRNSLLVLPSASSVAPLISETGLGGEGIERVRRTTMQLTCLAAIAGLPAVNIPLATENGLPCGLSILGPANRDADILALAVQLSESRLHQPKNEHASIEVLQPRTTTSGPHAGSDVLHGGHRRCGLSGA